MSINAEPKPVLQEYEDFAKNRDIKNASILTFDAPDGKDVYNPSAPFTSNGKEIIAGRVQARNGSDCVTMFFTRDGDIYKPIANAPILPLEDPFVCHINGEIVLGGMHVEYDDAGAASWRAHFYKGTDIYNLKEFAKGPAHTKGLRLDIRLLELPSGQIAVCTRPQGDLFFQKHGCMAKIGFTVLPSLSDFNAEAAEKAPFIQDIFLPDEWGGVNELHNLPNGKIGAIGHKSYMDVRDGVTHIHYYTIAFTICPDTLETGIVKVICSRDCFAGQESREPRLYNVTFPAGITQTNTDDRVQIYVGISDCKVGTANIPNPFNKS